MLFEISDVEDSTAAHYHDYIYTYFNDKKHICRCECGYITSMFHVVSSADPTICVECGGNVNNGLLGPLCLSGDEETNIDIEYTDNEKLYLEDNCYTETKIYFCIYEEMVN